MGLETSIPIIGGLLDDTDEQAMAELAKNKRLYENIKLPELTWQDYAPDLYTNETANYQLTNEDPALRSYQMDALKNMAYMADNGLSDVDQAAFAKARALGDQSARAGTQAAIQDAQARGVAGSGMEFAMREIANQGGSQRAQEAALQQAADAARQRALYAQAYQAGLGNVRGQDLQANKANTDIINQFNMANTQARNQTNQANTQVKNQAQTYNLEGQRNTQQQKFNNEMARTGGMSGANTQIANAYAAQNAANTSERNMLTQVGVQAGLAAMGAPSVPTQKKPGNSVGSGYTDYSAYA